MITVKKLTNGLTIASDYMPGIETVSLSIMVGTGSRHENDKEHGISHFLEHMAFKGTGTRSARDIAEEFDSIGGYFNAYTARERTVYYAKVLRGDVEKALEILADIYQNSAFHQKDIAQEKEVIIEEIAENQDSPEDLLFDFFYHSTFPQGSFGRSILGTAESVQNINQEDLFAFTKKHYHAGNTVVTAAGNIDANLWQDLVDKYFHQLPTGVKAASDSAIFQPNHFHFYKDLEQVHFIKAFPAVTYHHPDFYLQHMLALLLGGGMSSRLFQEAREKHGLTYNISSFVTSYMDTAMFSIYTSATEDKINKLIEIIVQELKKIGQHITQNELLRAKAQVKASILMQHESSGARAERLAGNLLAVGRYISNQEIIEKIDVVNTENLVQYAQNLFIANHSTAAVGRTNNLAYLK